MKRITMTPVIVAAAALVAGTAVADDGLDFAAKPSGAQEVVFDGDVFVPGGTNTDGIGTFKARFNKRLSVLTVDLTVNNLMGSFSAAHLHCARAGENGPVVFGLVSPGPLTLDGRRVRGRLDNLDYTGADCEGVVGVPVNNIASLRAAMEEGLIYVNVHTGAFPAGEIRGQVLEDDDGGDDGQSDGLR